MKKSVFDSKPRLIRTAALVAAVLLIVLSAVHLLLSRRKNPNLLTVHVLDVGDADCIVAFCGGRTLVIDTGESRTYPVLRNFLEKNAVRRVDALILTHPHSDHIGGAANLLRHFEVERVYMPKIRYQSPAFEKLDAALRQAKADVVFPQPGDQLSFGGGMLRFIGPVQPDMENANNNSLVCRLVYGERSFLFTGDMEKESEALLLFSDAILQSDVLKVAHHGSDTSSAAEFIRAVSPEIALISCGKGSLLSPAPSESVAALLRMEGAALYSTVRCGDISVCTDGKSLQVRTEK